MKFTGERQVAKVIEEVRGDHVGRYAHVAPRVEGLRVLDAACGCGYGSSILSVYAGKVVGVDISLEAVGFANDNWGAENIDFVALDACDYIGEFDAVVSFETIEHLANDEELLLNFAKQSKFLFASVPNENVLKFDPKRFNHHVRHYTPEEFEEKLNKCGWLVVKKFSQHSANLPDLKEDTSGRTLVYHCVRGSAC